MKIYHVIYVGRADMFSFLFFLYLNGIDAILKARAWCRDYN
jgi:hypothetical protein